MTTGGPPVAPLAQPSDPVTYVVIDDEPAYRERLLPEEGSQDLKRGGGYGSVDAFIAVHRAPCHVVVLDLRLNRQNGDAAVLQGVSAVRLLAQDFGHRVLVHSADERPEPVARCVAAGAVGYVSKFAPDQLAEAIREIGRVGHIVTPALNSALRDLARHSLDIRLSAPLEETLRLLGRGLTDAQVADLRHLSPRTVEDHKRKILMEFGSHMEQRRIGFSGLTEELGIGNGDLVNDPAGGRPARGLIARAMPWARRRGKA